MRVKRKIGIQILSLIALASSRGKINSPEVTDDELKRHVSYLASETLKGRGTGTEGDSLAALYIRNDLNENGFVPIFGDGFQRYRVTDQIIFGPANGLIVNGTFYKVETDFFPFTFSENNSFSAEVVFAGYGFGINEDSLKWNDYIDVRVKGKVVMPLANFGQVSLLAGT
jgi:aminopeptidase YwaD